MFPLNYLSEILEFYNWIVFNPLPPDAQALWHTLLYLNNKCAIKVDGVWYWRVEYTVSNTTLVSILGFSRQQLDRMRNVLMQAGRIVYKKGKGNRSGTYTLNPFGAQYVTHYVTQPETQTVTQVWSQSGPLINNNMQSPTGYLSLGDVGAGSRAGAGGPGPPCEESGLSAYLEELNGYFGMTEEFKAELTQYTEKLFGRYFGRKPTNQDIVQVFYRAHGSEQHSGEWDLYLDPDKTEIVELLLSTRNPRVLANKIP